MPLSYSIDVTTEVVTFHYVSDPPFSEWASTMDAVLRDSAFRHGYGFLLDRSQITTAAETEYIRRIVEYVRAHEHQLSSSRVAVLVQGVAPYGMARMAQILLDQTKSDPQVFSSRDEALEWLSSGRTRHTDT